MRVALTAILALLLLPSAASANFVGVLADGPSVNGSVDFSSQAQAMKASGVTWVRVPVSWAAVEPRPGEYNFEKLDYLVGSAAKAGIEVMPTVVHAPYWAAEPPVAVNSPPTNTYQYGRFMKTLALRYGLNGSFWVSSGVYRPVRRFQVWNEPDMNYAWRSKGDWAAGYVSLLKSAKAAITEVDPGAKVVLAGLTNLSDRSLRLIYRQGGRRYFDVAALHPFNSRVSGVIGVVERMRKEMRRSGDNKKPLILSEVSWSSGGGEAIIRSSGKVAPWDTSEKGQARQVSQLARALKANRVRLRIQSFAWACWLSPELGSRYWFHYTGLNRLKGSKVVAKPALKAFKDSFAGF